APWPAGLTSWCSTSRPTISIWKRSTCCRSCWRTTPEPCCWSATTATSSIASPPRPSQRKDAAAGSNMPAAIPTCRRNAGNRRRAKRQRVDRTRLLAPRPAGARKLSFKEKHALETLPARIEQLHADIAAHEAALADADLFARDRTRFDQVTGALAAARGELAQAEERWLELEMLREEL